ncbi:MAG: hypothetical protein M3468_06590 [Acidobacteriota bacterium]|nr:hypothetical protein [Acidobacteriota bacterium]
MHLDLRPGQDRDAVVQRALDLGARREQSDAITFWTVLLDPDGNPFCVLQSVRHTRPGVATPISRSPRARRALCDVPIVVPRVRAVIATPTDCVLSWLSIRSSFVRTCCSSFGR